MKFCLWITGLPGSGKSTITEKLEIFLMQLNIEVLVLNLDEIRKFVTPEPTYKEEERDVLYGNCRIAFPAL